MGMYALVASTYDRYHDKYLDEVEIKLSGGPKNKLHQIDLYTSTSTKIDILGDLRKKGFIINQDTLSIRYLKSREDSPIYYNVIYDHPNLKSCLNDLIEKKYSIGKTKSAPAIRYNNEYFNEEWSKLKSLILTGKNAEIKSLYKNRNQLLFLIDRYLTSPYDDEITKERDLEAIKAEFSRYKTFRGWIVANTKKRTLKKTVSSKIVKPTIPFKIKKPISIEDAEKEFEKRIEENQGISYQAYAMSSYNQRYLEDDKEEFLEEDEMDQIYGKKL